MGRLTKAQLWALQAIADGFGGTPSALGQRMVERPGVAEKAGRGRIAYKAQGYGRMGGAMMARLRRMQLITTSLGTSRFWHPTKATITEAGRAALREATPEQVVK